MIKTMYEVNWHYVNERFSHCTVTPITVTREGVSPGCTGVSIDAIDHTGRKFIGSPRNYFDSEEAAWSEVKTDLLAMVEAKEAEMAKLKDEVFALFKFAVKLK